MIKDLAWHFFKKTGDISTFLEFKNLDDNLKNITENNVVNKEKLGGLFGNYKNKRNSNKPRKF